MPPAKRKSTRSTAGPTLSTEISSSFGYGIDDDEPPAVPKRAYSMASECVSTTKDGKKSKPNTRAGDRSNNTQSTHCDLCMDVEALLLDVVTMCSKRGTLVKKQQASIAKRLKDIGNAAFGKEDYTKAILYYSKGIELCPDMTALWSNRAACYLALGDFDKVVEDCTNVIDKNPDYVKAYVRRSSAYEKQGKLRESLQDMFTLCVVTNTPLVEFLGVAKFLYKRLLINEIGIYRSRLESQFSFNALQNRSHAFTVLESVFDFSLIDGIALAGDYKPYTVEYYLVAACMHARKYEYNESFNMAQCAYGKVTTLSPYYELASELYCIFMIVEKELEKARDMIIQFIADRGYASPAIYILHSGTFVQLGHYNKSLEVLANGIHKFPASHLLHYHVGQYHLSQCDYPRANASFIKAQKLCPSFVPAYLKHARSTLCSTNNPTYAKEMLQRTLCDRPELLSHPLVCTFMAEMLLANGSIEEAQGVLENAVESMGGEKHPYPCVYWRLASIYERQNMFDEAIDVCNKAIMVDPVEYTSYTEIAKLHYVQKRYKNALNVLKESIECATCESTMTERAIAYEKASLFYTVEESIPLRCRHTSPEDLYAQNDFHDVYKFTPR